MSDGAAARWMADLLRARWFVRSPIPLYRAGLGWLFGARLVMIEHRGRVSREPRFVVVEVVEREGNAIRVASGFGEKAQWYRNLRANGVAYLSTGRARRVPASVRFLDDEEARAVLARYAEVHPAAWKQLSAAMAELAGEDDPRIPVVEFGPRRFLPGRGRSVPALSGFGASWGRARCAPTRGLGAERSRGVGGPGRGQTSTSPRS